MPFATRAPRSSRRPASTTFAPRRANPSAVACPIPDVPPTTSATLPSNEIMCRSASVALRNERLLVHRRADVVLVFARRQLERRRRQVLVIDHRQQVRDAVEPRPALVVGLDDPPRCVLDVGVAE